MFEAYVNALAMEIYVFLSLIVAVALNILIEVSESCIYIIVCLFLQFEEFKENKVFRILLHLIASEMILCEDGAFLDVYNCCVKKFSAFY
jgi:hypothetical protein